MNLSLAPVVSSGKQRSCPNRLKMLKQCESPQNDKPGSCGHCPNVGWSYNWRRFHVKHFFFTLFGIEHLHVGGGWGPGAWFRSEFRIQNGRRFNFLLQQHLRPQISNSVFFKEIQGDTRVHLCKRLPLILAVTLSRPNLTQVCLDVVVMGIENRKSLTPPSILPPTLSN